MDYNGELHYDIGYDAIELFDWVTERRTKKHFNRNIVNERKKRDLAQIKENMAQQSKTEKQLLNLNHKMDQLSELVQKTLTAVIAELDKETRKNQELNNPINRVQREWKKDVSPDAAKRFTLTDDQRANLQMVKKAQLKKGYNSEFLDSILNFEHLSTRQYASVQKTLEDWKHAYELF